MKKKPLLAMDIPPRTQKSTYPSPYAIKMEGRTKRQIGNFFEIQKFGVNLTIIEPGGQSALLHQHSKQEEFIYVLEGQPTLVTENEEYMLAPGMCVGFPAGGDAHMLVNRTSKSVTYLEVGDRESGDLVNYPHDDLIAEMGQDGNWHFRRKNGEAY